VILLDIVFTSGKHGFNKQFYKALVMITNNASSSVYYRVEEYKQLKEEIRQRDSSMTTLFHTGLIANISLVSAISAFYFKMYSDAPSCVPILLSYFFLAPILLLISLLSMINSHRRDIRKIASYLQAFYEDTQSGPTWETAHNEMAKLNPEEAHDFVPSTLWCLFVICISLFYYTLHLTGQNIVSWHSILPLCFFIPMAAIHLRYFDSKEVYYNKYLKAWREIFEKMNNMQKL
jgi:hypothetical protein